MLYKYFFKFRFFERSFFQVIITSLFLFVGLVLFVHAEQQKEVQIIPINDFGDLKVGDKIGAWTVSAILDGKEATQKKEVQFKGTITISGLYYQGIYRGLEDEAVSCFIPNSSDVTKFPQFSYSSDILSKAYLEIHVCFSNNKEAEVLLNTKKSRTGQATIELLDFKLIDSEGGQQIGTAVLKKVASRSSVSICKYPILQDGGEGWSWNPVDPRYINILTLGGILTDKVCGRKISSKKYDTQGPLKIRLSKNPSKLLQQDLKKLGYYCDQDGKKNQTCRYWTHSCKAISEKDVLIFKKHISSIAADSHPADWGCLDKEKVQIIPSKPSPARDNGMQTSDERLLRVPIAEPEPQATSPTTTDQTVTAPSLTPLPEVPSPEEDTKEKAKKLLKEIKKIEPVKITPIKPIEPIKLIEPTPLYSPQVQTPQLRADPLLRYYDSLSPF